MKEVLATLDGWAHTESMGVGYDDTDDQIVLNYNYTIGRLLQKQLYDKLHRNLWFAEKLTAELNKGALAI